MNEKFYEKHAWIIFLIIGIIILAGALPHAFGFNTDPALVKNISTRSTEELKSSSQSFFSLYDFYFRGGGLSDIGVAFFLIIISLTAYRRGQKWSWFTMWFVPVYFLLWILLTFRLPTAARSSLLLPLIMIFILSILGLCLPLRKFFPKSI